MWRVLKETDSDTWKQGLNSVTIATSINLISMAVTIHLAAEWLYQRMDVFLSRKESTICRLLVSAVGYIGAIAVILYTLSMFGVRTATLVGGAGAVALVFTLGANSLVADVLAGIFIIFDGDYMVGDKIQIGDFTGIVTDISIRCTTLDAARTHDVKIIHNSTIKEVINKSRQVVRDFIEIPIGRGVDLEEAENRIRHVLEGMAKRHPELVADPEYLGVTRLPEVRPYTKVLEQCTVTISFSCLEKDRFAMSLVIRRELVDTVNDLLYGTPAIREH